ncbi:MAG: class I SAM-dependent methyltransferase [Methylacidiphilales bacterium]|nr:class I SAM-dependent methyltransferase [Candidatus Methylacidiphilales bacterium]
MHGTNLQRLGRLAGNLVAHPRYIGKYIATSLSSRLTPLKLQLPWFSYAAIEFLEKFLRPTMQVFEYGGGGSTVFFARRTAEVRCIESSEEWAAKIKPVLEREKIANVTLEVHPFDPNDVVAFGRSPYLLALKDRLPDVIVVDGYEESVPLRPICFQLAETVIKPGGIIIVDDSWRYLPLREKNRARHWTEFRSVGPCRRGVTSTDVFFY